VKVKICAYEVQSRFSRNYSLDRQIGYQPMKSNFEPLLPLFPVPLHHSMKIIFLPGEHDFHGSLVSVGFFFGSLTCCGFLQGFPLIISLAMRCVECMDSQSQVFEYDYNHIEFKNLMHILNCRKKIRLQSSHTTKLQKWVQSLTS